MDARGLNLQLRIWFLHVTVPIKKWAGETASNIHLCLFFAALQVVMALILRDVDALSPIPAWLLAAYFAWRLHGISQQALTLTLVTQVQQAIVRTVLQKASLVKDTGGESLDGNLGSGPSTSGNLPAS